MQTVIDAITNWLKRTKNHRDVAADTELIGLGILDSIEILNLVSFLEERFGVTLPIEEFIPENFQSPRAIADLVVRLGPAVSAA
jgi:acyl carrier protein